MSSTSAGRRPWADSAKVFGVLLAAGASRRFETGPKLAATFDGVPLLRRACEALAHSSVDGAIVVLGESADQLHHHCAAANLEWTQNRDADRGQSSSLITGLQSAPTDSIGCIFLAADQPLLTSTEIDKVLQAGLKHNVVARATAPPSSSSFGSPQHGPPVYFPNRYFELLLQSHGDEGARQILRRLGDEEIRNVEVPAVTLIDIDSASDLDRLRALLEPRER